MANTKTATRESVETRSPVQIVRDAADSMFRAACECYHQHDRAARVHGKSKDEEEVRQAQISCAHSDDVLGSLAESYEKVAANFHPTAADQDWWHRANSLWLSSREYVRHIGGCDDSSRQLKAHGPDRLDTLHMEYELEASALLALSHASEAYRQKCPDAA
jgi:hypothetical protein